MTTLSAVLPTGLLAQALESSTMLDRVIQASHTTTVLNTCTAAVLGACAAIEAHLDDKM